MMNCRNDAASGKMRAARVLLAVAAIASSTGAMASDWTHVAGEAAIELPAPTRAEGIFGAALRCTEQRWSLDLTLEPGRETPTEMPSAVLAVGEQRLDVIGKAATGGISLPLARLAIGPLKGGIQFKVDFPGVDPALGATFSLRGSKAAIAAAEPLCSKRDMTGYGHIALSPYSSYLLEAAELRQEEIKVFKQATASTPTLAAGLTTLDGDRQLLFVEACGSSWYYGASGCNLAGFARTSSESGWTLVYDAEGADLYQDNGTAVDGWPNLISLPKKGGGDEIVWAWNGAAYAVAPPDLVGSVPTAAAETGQ
jgi:hypothetical protein